jgi:hypothetical protein
MHKKERPGVRGPPLRNGRFDARRDRKRALADRSGREARGASLARGERAVPDGARPTRRTHGVPPGSR